MKLDPNNPRYQICYGWLWLTFVLLFLPLNLWLHHLISLDKPGPIPLAFSMATLYPVMMYLARNEVLNSAKKRREMRTRSPFNKPLADTTLRWQSKARGGAIAYCIVTGISLIVGHFFPHPTPSEIFFDSIFLPLCWILMPWADSRTNLTAIRNILDDTRALDEPVEAPAATAISPSDEVQTLRRR